jgi:importin subunit alpha-6/7
VALSCSHKISPLRLKLCAAGNKEQIQAVIENNIIPPLIQLLSNAEFDIRKEAAWAISNATSGGNEQQIHFLVQQGCIRPLCDLLTGSDTKIVTIALEGIENILRVGDEEARATNTPNQMAIFVSEAEGLNKIEDLQQHSNNDIYEKAIKMLETYFGVEEEEEMTSIAPGTVVEGNHFQFGMQAPPPSSSHDPSQQQQQQGGGGFDFTRAL